MWEEAEKLAGGSVSGLIADALRHYVEEKKRRDQDMESIEGALGGRNSFSATLGDEPEIELGLV